MTKTAITFDNQRRRRESITRLSSILASAALDDYGQHHIRTALQAVKDLDSRSTNRDYTDAFYFASKHVSYALHLRNPR